MPVHPQGVTTALEFEGHRIVGYRGVVRGITVRSRNLIVNLGATIQTLFGGNIPLYTELCERARQDAFDLMLEHAAQMGANAVVAMRYDANDVAAGVTEVLCYGTAVATSSLRVQRANVPASSPPAPSIPRAPTRAAAACSE